MNWFQHTPRLAYYDIGHYVHITHSPRQSKSLQEYNRYCTKNMNAGIEERCLVQLDSERSHNDQFKQQTQQQRNHPGQEHGHHNGFQDLFDSITVAPRMDSQQMYRPLAAVYSS
ncbi:hypothetical protein EYF80_012397 [Liparis tanakae]|uniref:Uncharacterized protein n=1 Tax=Liparis tanakae TaxID=230148 RepID=A0A4Z2IJC7_9TELE|nr:hypothetical protein EYF80_012397 [Liparis tanakae]